MEPREAYEIRYERPRAGAEEDEADAFAGADDEPVDETALERSVGRGFPWRTLPARPVPAARRRLIYGYNSKKNDVLSLQDEVAELGITSYLPDVTSTMDFAWAAIQVGDVDSFWRQFTKLREWELKTIDALERERERRRGVTHDGDVDDRISLSRVPQGEAQNVLSEATASLGGGSWASSSRS